MLRRLSHGVTSALRRPTGLSACFGGIPIERVRCVTAACERKSCPFTTLGLQSSATRNEVKIKYKYLAKTEHPDCGGSEERFKEINAAYLECNRLIDEREFDNKYSTSATTESQSHSAYTQQATRYDFNDGFNEPHMRHPRADSERRERMGDLFETVAAPDDIDELLVHCLQSHVFDTTDIGEPLLRALGRYHFGMPLGESHVRRCFDAINRWEDWHHKKAPQSYYHPLLVLYSDTAAAAENAMTDISEGVTAILEEIEAKGYIPDDWSVTLANRVFRTSPHAW